MRTLCVDVFQRPCTVLLVKNRFANALELELFRHRGQALRKFSQLARCFKITAVRGVLPLVREQLCNPHS